MHEAPLLGRVRPDGVSTRLRDVHRERGAAGGARRRAPTAVRDQAGGGARADAATPGHGRHPRPAGVPARHLLSHAAAAHVAPGAPAPVHARAAARGPGAPPRPPAGHTDRAGAGPTEPPQLLVRAQEGQHQGAASGGGARRQAARRARRPPPPRPLRTRHHDRDLARRRDRRAAVLVHRPRARHLRR